MQVWSDSLQVRISCSSPHRDFGVFFSFGGGGSLLHLCAMLTLKTADYPVHVRSSSSKGLRIQSYNP